jgi:hypothetical protein
VSLSASRYSISANKSRFIKAHKFEVIPIPGKCSEKEENN